MGKRVLARRAWAVALVLCLALAVLPVTALGESRAKGAAVVDTISGATSVAIQLPKFKGAKVEWKVENEKVAELVKNGTAVRGLKKGGSTNLLLKVIGVAKAVIGGHSLKPGVYKIPFEVLEKNKLIQKIVLPKEQRKLKLAAGGEGVQLSPRVLPRTADKAGRLFAVSSNPAVATVNAKGMVKPVGKGKANIVIYSSTLKTVKVPVIVK